MNINKYLIATNPYALNAALELVVGKEASVRVGKVYNFVDDLLRTAYMAGCNDTAQAAAYAAEQDEATTYQDGHGDGFDDGYAAGVHDARVRPEHADEVIQQMIADGLVEAAVALDNDIFS